MSELIAPSPNGRSGVSWPKAAALVAALLFCILPAMAEHTRFWRQSDYDAFQKGDAKGVALRSDGKIVLAPKFAPFADASSPIFGPCGSIPTEPSTARAAQTPKSSSSITAASPPPFLNPRT